MQIDPYLCMKLKFKWIKDLNINLVTLNMIVKKVEKSLELTGTGDSFLNRKPVAQTLRSTINKRDFIN